MGEFVFYKINVQLRDRFLYSLNPSRS